MYRKHATAAKLHWWPKKIGHYISNIVRTLSRERAAISIYECDAIKLARDRVETNKWISLICVLVILLGSVGLG